MGSNEQSMKTKPRWWGR